MENGKDEDYRRLGVMRAKVTRWVGEHILQFVGLNLGRTVRPRSHLLKFVCLLNGESTTVPVRSLKWCLMDD